MTAKLILFSIFILLNSLSALTKAEIIKETLNCCKSQLASNRKDAIGLMLLHYLSTETTNNRDVILLQARIKRGLDINATEKGDLLKLSKLYAQAAVVYIRAKSYKKAAYYLAMSEKLNPLSDNALINQHLLQEKGFKVSIAQLLGPYGTGGLTVSKANQGGTVNQNVNTGKVIVSGRFKAIKLPVNTMTFKIKDHYYALIMDKATWKVAKAKAESFGGYLACITSPGENEAILKFVKKQHIWLGATDEIKEGTYKWVNGERFSFTQFTGQNPDNYGGNEDFLAFYEGAWNDMNSVALNDGYLVEWDK